MASGVLRTHPGGSMELWQVRKRYRQVAMRLRRRKGPADLMLQTVEEQVLATLALCDRLETELCVLKMARRCARARLRRLRRWVESSGIYPALPAPLTRKDDVPAVEELERELARHGRDSTSLRQLLDELAWLDRRTEDSRERLARMSALGARNLELLLTYVRARGIRLSLERPTGGD